MTCCSATRQESFLLITAYEIASQYFTNEQCQLTLGSLIPLSPFFSVSQPATFNSTELQSVAQDSFSTYVGFSECSGGGEDVRIASPSNPAVATVLATPTTSNTSALAPVTSGPDLNSTQSISPGTNGHNSSSTQSVSTHSSGSYNKTIEVANGVAIPVALGLVLLGFLLYRRRKNRKTLKEEGPTSQDLASPQEDPQPYLQQKAELEAEEIRKHELEARERRCEMSIGEERYELPGEEGDLMIRSRQELRGEEHSRELEVPR